MDTAKILDLIIKTVLLVIGSIGLVSVLKFMFNLGQTLKMIEIIDKRLDKIETNHLSHIEKDIGQIKTDMSNQKIVCEFKHKGDK